jgi:hypothetical protein
MKVMFEAVATPANLKRMIPIPEAGYSHKLGC